MSDWGNKRLNKDASCLLWWCGRDGIFGYCNMFPTRVTDDYNSTKCKIQDAEHRIDHLLIAYLKQLNRRLNGEVELGCQPDKNEFFSCQTLENFITSDIMSHNLWLQLEWPKWSPTCFSWPFITFGPKMVPNKLKNSCQNFSQYD